MNKVNMLKKVDKYESIFMSKMSEAFKSGTNMKVMKLLGSLLLRKTGTRIDPDIPEGYQDNLGKFRAYTGYMKNGKEIRINFLLSDSDYIHSVDLFDSKGKRIDGVKFEQTANIVQIVNTITDLINGQLQKLDEGFTKSGGLLTEKRRRKSAMSDIVKAWIMNPSTKKERENLIQTKVLSKVFPIFIRDIDHEVKLPSQGTFVKFVKEYLKDNGMVNPFIRARFKKKKISSEIPIILPEEKSLVGEMKAPTALMADWHDAFMDLEDDFEDLMTDKNEMPYGQLVYGNGGSGKSFFFLSQKDKHDMQFIKGSLNTSKLVRVLYDYRDKDVIVFDDADSVVTTNNSANILKMATDDSVAQRVVYLPKSSGADIKGGIKKSDGTRTLPIEPDVLDSNGNLLDAFKFNASIVVITNLKDIKDKALKSRLYLNPIFMTKEDIIEKIKETSVPQKLGCTDAMGNEVAEFLTSLVESGQFDIKNEQLSYRFFKMGLKFIKNRPDRWKGVVMRKLGIGIRTSI